MDWLEEIKKWFKRKLFSITLFHELLCYIFTAILVIVLFTLATSSICRGWMNLIMQNYIEKSQIMNDMMGMALYDEDLFLQITDTMPNKDRIILVFLQAFQTGCILLYSAIGILTAMYLFIKNKIKEPLYLLKQGTYHIQNNQLDYDCKYNSRDEMGEMCTAFDQMRLHLIENNRQMFSMMEEQRRLNAAFAHDLRTPLTVLHGYTDLLAQYYPEGKISSEKLLETLHLMNDQICRLERFGNTMKEVNRIEDLEAAREEVSIYNIQRKVKETAMILDGKNGIQVRYHSRVMEKKSLLLDESLFFEVMENIISNGIRYAKSTLEVILEESDDEKQLILNVFDDGPGFTKQGLKMASKPYYSSETQDALHFGIGLYISKILCERHKGTLIFNNSITGGAVVSGIFSIV